ncbi:excinuclease ABC subunit A [Microbulbifer donghaiensis]|uniref:UvrABC system protein A n=1 Tax=Microbulbifer donghaiensis TaxID=494016 RepID=A0A1M5HTC3_9GAMM|nr:excinuclease ABC subunit UvrA [Microbulbifer donghaiensis]SHG19187.1 excinuclease ABC subunit A [Microbulbifer donghaiensis]
MDTIYVRGARTHNLKNIDLDIPRDKLIVITGLSGSGKSSLAFDTLYAEGQRRYVESLSTYARQFLSMMEKPDVDTVEGLSPAISIEQKSTSHNPRSTVGTITEIYDYLRLLFARVGEPRCPDHAEPLQAQTVSQMVDQVLALPEGTKLMLLAPVVRDRKGEHLHVFEQLRRDGFVRARIDGVVCDLDDTPKLDKRKKHTVEVVVDRFKVRDDLQLRLAESFETALNLTDGIASISFMEGKQEDRLFSARHACPVCDYSLDELEPRLFSFNNPAGACPGCDGLGVKQFFDEEKVILDPGSSISEGAIRGWDRRNIYYYHMLDSLAEHYGFDLDKPWSKLAKKYREVILRGSGDTPIDFSYVNDRGDVTIRRHTFEGIIPNFQRRYRDTESQSVREELAKYLSTQKCPECHGTRLRREARHVFVDNRTLAQITELPVGDAFEYFTHQLGFTGAQKEIADKILKELRDRFRFLVDVGLNYLTLNRSAETLSGGEAQRIRLASQIGAGLVGVMYILDEPSIGLHQRDNERLLATLTHLRDIGNTVIVVEHDEDAIRSADFIVDIGPGAGVHGGEVVAAGSHDQIAACERSLTGQYLSGRKQIAVPAARNPAGDELLRIEGATGNNLQNVDLEIPVGLFTCVTGVSGSGKSTLINTTLYPLAATALNKATTLKASPYEAVHGLEHFDKCVDIDQSPIGRTPRSNPATYTGIFTPIRDLFAGTQEARSRGYKPGRFSFNVKGGRCEACQGDGVIKVEMHFLPDIYVPCDTCKGKRYNRETLEVHYKGKNIHEVLEMTVEDAREFFDPVPAIAKKLQTLMDVGLSYIKLGQAATTLSGGEAQRVKLSRELSKRDTGKTLYILDEPTTGLHFADIQLLLDVLHRLRDHGNTIVVIEHNLDVIKTADWIVDLGPEGGSGGGQIIATGTPEQVAKIKASHTGRFLKPMLAAAKA